MTILPVSTLEEEVAILDEAVTPPGAHHGPQYGLKFLGAAISNMTASGVSNPVDVIKVRQQLKTQSQSFLSFVGLSKVPSPPLPPPAPGVKANAFWKVGYQMARTEGIRSLGNGFAASMMREASYSGLRLGTYEFFKDRVYELSKGSLSRDSLTLKVCGATIAASIGSFVANPADLVKVRMQAHYPAGKPYRHTLDCLISVWREGAHKQGVSSPFAGGIRSLYRGVEATTIRGIVLSVSQICSYDHVKHLIKKRGLMEEGLKLHLTASLFAGLFCSITSNPIDVVKVRVMNDKERKFKGVFDCVRSIIVKEGPLAFYKGFGMCWARLGTHTIVSFLVFERVRLLFGISPL